MNKVLLFGLYLLLVLLPIGLEAQVEYLVDTDKNLFLQNVKLDNNGDFISVFLEDSVDYHFAAGIIKFDKEFNYQMYIHDIDTADVLVRDFVVTSENNYLIAGTIGKDNGEWYSNHIIYILLLDEDFNFMAENFYYLPEEYTNPYIKIFKNDDGRIYLILDRGAPPYILKGILELSNSGQIAKEQMYYDMGGAIMNPFTSPQNGFYLLRGSEVAWAVGEITEVDTSLNFTTMVLPAYVNGQWYNMGPRGSCKWLNDTTYILISEGAETKGHDLYLYKMNSQHEFLTEPFIIGRENEDDQSLRYRGIDWTDPEHIYIASWEYASNYQPNEYFVAVIDENFEVLGSKSVGGEDNNTAVNSLLATEDGGCVMVGSQRKYQTGDESDWNGYVAFFSPDDIITSAVETTNPYDSDYLLFPNPGNDQLIIQTARKGVRLKMYNQSGKIVLEKQLPDVFRSTVNTDQLIPGFYLCQLTDKKGNTEYKKWIKQ